MVIERILETEKSYLAEFSKVEMFADYTRYRDISMPDMYSHNFTWIREPQDFKALSKIIDQEIYFRRTEQADYLRVMIDGWVSLDDLKKIVNQANDKVVIDRMDYYYRNSDDWSRLPEKEDVQVILATEPHVFEHGKAVDIIANYKHMEVGFAVRRINRKLDIYKDDAKNTSLYVCYHKEEPVGNCELHICPHAAKIEDFDIVDIYQRKGFGTQVVKALMKAANDKGVKTVYMVTDHEDTAKEMYEKNGFTLAGYRYEILFDLK